MLLVMRKPKSMVLTSIQDPFRVYDDTVYILSIYICQEKFALSEFMSSATDRLNKLLKKGVVQGKEPKVDCYGLHPGNQGRVRQTFRRHPRAKRWSLRGVYFPT